MEGTSIIIPVLNKFETTRKCIDHIGESNRGSLHEIIIVDNGSTDKTQQFFSTAPESGGGHDNTKLVYIRNEDNLGVSKALNMGAAAAGYDILCFMHNDVFVQQENWTASISKFISNHAKAGVVGLYGAKTIRKDGSFRGKTIVHAEMGKPAMTGKYVKVAVVDGLLLAMHKQVYEKVRGFCDGFIMHFYDKDISLRAYKNSLDNYVLNIPFEHACNTTRSDLARDDHIRDEAQSNFMELWSMYLPADVSTVKDRISYAVKRRKRK